MVSLADWGYSPQDLGFDPDDDRECEKPEYPCQACGQWWCSGTCPQMAAWLDAQNAALDAARERAEGSAA